MRFAERSPPALTLKVPAFTLKYVKFEPLTTPEMSDTAFSINDPVVSVTFALMLPRPASVSPSWSAPQNWCHLICEFLTGPLGQKELSMKGKKHTPEQIIGKLREADAELNGGASIGQVCQKLGISEPTLHRWREQYGGMKADAAKRPRNWRKRIGG